MLDHSLGQITAAEQRSDRGHEILSVRDRQTVVRLWFSGGLHTGLPPPFSACQRKYKDMGVVISCPYLLSGLSKLC